MLYCPAQALYVLYCVVSPRGLQYNTTQQPTRLQHNVSSIQQPEKPRRTGILGLEYILVLYWCCNYATQNTSRMVVAWLQHSTTHILRLSNKALSDCTNENLKLCAICELTKRYFPCYNGFVPGREVGSSPNRIERAFKARGRDAEANERKAPVAPGEVRQYCLSRPGNGNLLSSGRSPDLNEQERNNKLKYEKETEQ